MIKYYVSDSTPKVCCLCPQILDLDAMDVNGKRLSLLIINKGTTFKGKLLTLSTNIRLGLIWLGVTNLLNPEPGSTKRGSIILKQEVDGTVILPPLVFPAVALLYNILL
jgi:hypothetical protein